MAGYTQADFQRQLRSAIRGCWSGTLNKSDFINAMDSTLSRGLQAAWFAGSLECGVKPDELTPDEKAALALMVYQQQSFVGGLADAVVEGSKANGGKLQPLLDRSELWVNRWNEAQNKGKVLACGNKKLKWVWDPTIEKHCRDCKYLNGKIYRSSVWQNSINIAPQNSRLACRGFRCGCRFVVTDEPVTKGRPPKF